MWTSARSSSSRAPHRAGFSLLELLIAMFILALLLVMVQGAFGTGLRVKRDQQVTLGVQQNLRVAVQQIAQDLRSSADLHLWQQASGCAALSTPCSTGDELTVLSLVGIRSAIPETPGATFSNSAQTSVCDGRLFKAGDTILVYTGNGGSALVEVENVLPQRDYSQPCKGPPSTPNHDKIQHKQKIGGTWSQTSYAFGLEVPNYSVIADPIDPTRKVLYRRTGFGSEGPRSGIVAFDVTALRVSYGVPIDPDDDLSQLRFYPTLEAAADELGKAYTADPAGVGIYVGRAVKAVRVQVTGTSDPTAAGTPTLYTLSEIVDLRRDNR